MARIAWIVCVGALMVVGLPTLAGTAVAQSGETRWVFKEVAANTADPPSGQQVTRTATSFSRQITIEPTAEFNTTFPDMMIASAAAGETHSFTVNVEGRISPGADTDVQGFRPHDAIRLVNDRWDGRTAVGVGVNCVTDIFGAPLGCTPEAGTFTRASATWSVTFPTYVPSDGEYSFGIGALNCSACYVKYVYEARTVEPEPELRCRGKVATIGPDARDSDGVITGTNGRDVIVGSNGPDIIRGRGGNDIICGRGGADIIRGHGGRDQISGQGGADTIYGGKRGDIISGGPGNDDITGDSGDDTLDGDRGKDTIRGGKGGDVARGGPGTDRCAAEREFSCEKDPKIPGPRVNWTMESRYGEASDDGIVRPTADLDPNRYKVRFKLRHGDGSKCSRNDEVTVTSPKGKFRTPNPNKPCTIEGRFREGTYRAKFRLTTDEGSGSTTERVVVQDWLIVGIGDSNGSGEGTPDVPRGERARWVNKQCHRSANSYQALTALWLEKKDKKTSVTFKHFSCSGAQIRTGLLRRYEGIIPGPKLAPQLNRVDSIAEKREIDAVIISVGVNDLRFGPMVSFCVLYEDCPNRIWETFGTETLAETMEGYLAALPDLYDDLDTRLLAADIPRNRVYITEYFDSTKDQNGVVCDPLIRFGHGLRDFDQAEATWAAESVLQPLNAHVRAAADRYGWNLVSGSEARFREHGYCAGDESWIVTREQSDERQGDENGTLHSTRHGNLVQRRFVLPVITEDFYDSEGEPRRPR